MFSHLQHASLLAVVIILLSSCTSNIITTASYKWECIRANRMHLNQESRSLFNIVLSRQLDSKRRKYNGKDFCAYYELTADKKYALITVFDQVGNHMSPTWVLLSHNRAVDTKLDKFEMATDSLKAMQKILMSVDELIKDDSSSKHELIKLMAKDARFYARK